MMLTDRILAELESGPSTSFKIAARLEQPRSLSRGSRAFIFALTNNGPARAKWHGMSGTPTFRTWTCMVQRCTNPKNTQYPWYGGRGIAICDRWQDFRNFFADMGVRPDGKTLDRIDSNGNYTPENCRWSDKQTQSNNTRRNRILTIDGERLTMAQASRRWGIRLPTIWQRLNLGWADHDAAKRPLKGAAQWK
jgi:hypothetical protein